MGSCATTREECTWSVLFSFPYLSAVSFPHLFPCQSALKPGSAAKELRSRSVFVHLFPSLSRLFPHEAGCAEAKCYSYQRRTLQVGYFLFFPSSLSSVISDLFPYQAMQRSRVSTAKFVGMPGQFQELSLFYLSFFHHLFCLELFLGCL